MRLIAACKNCKAQYDVSHQKAHDHLHCSCGGMIEVPEVRKGEARLVRCPSCGAARGSGGSNCEFCGARFTAVDKGWASMCPGCYCRLPNSAQFCVECGLKINPQALEASKSKLQCPRCDCSLQTRTIDEFEINECGACGGMWLSADTFRVLCDTKQTDGVVTRGLAMKKSRNHFELSDQDKVKYVPCPKCKNLMNRRNFGRVSGIVIDTCRDCGVWLDNQELNLIIQFVQAGGLDKTREVEAREREHAAKMHSRMKTRPRHGGGASAGGTGFEFQIFGSERREKSIVAPMLAKVVVEIAKAFFSK
jgi:Zn-finger nucleic acid-binding protein